MGYDKGNTLITMDIDRKNASMAEMIIGLVLIAVFIGVLYSKYQSLETASKQTVRSEEVKILNLATILYKIKNGNFPENITVVLDEKYVDNSSLIFLDTGKRLNGKVFIDPLGSPYRYDNITGKVK